VAWIKEERTRFPSLRANGSGLPDRLREAFQRPDRHVWTAPSRQEHFWYFGK
jgi:hypothetical protein